MARRVVFSTLAIVFLLTACGSTPAPTAPPAATPVPTATAPPTPTPVLVSAFTDFWLRAGPGSDYAETAQVAKEADVALLGVARGRDCAQWALVRTPAGDEGWVRPILVNVDVEKSVISPVPTPTPVNPPTPLPATCTGEMALVQVNNNFGVDLEAFLAGAEPGLTFAIDSRTSRFVCVAAGEYCFDLTDGENHETGALFFPGGDCTCWHLGGGQPRAGGCQCPEDPGSYERP